LFWSYTLRRRSLQKVDLPEEAPETQVVTAPGLMATQSSTVGVLTQATPPLSEQPTIADPFTEQLSITQLSTTRSNATVIDQLNRNDELNSGDEPETIPVNKVLVVEDNPINQKLLNRQLSLLGVDSDLANNGHEGLQAWMQTKYPLILTDYSMPGMNGLELAGMIREKEKSGQVRTAVVLVSANVMEEIEFNNDDLIDDFINKPIEMAVLKQVLETYLPKVGASFTRQSMVQEKKIESEQHIDYSALEDVVGVDFGIQEEIFKIFLSNTPNTLCELQTAIAGQSSLTAKKLAHKLKSSAKAVCATQLANSCGISERQLQLENWDAVRFSLDQLKMDFTKTVESIQSYLKNGGTQIKKATPNLPTDLNSVLIIDDDETTLNQIAAILGALGVDTVHKAASGQDALRLLNNSKKIDMLLCDLQMPGMDGIEFLRHVSNRDYRGGLILISGGDKRVLRAVSVLAQEHKLNILGALAKPVTISSISDVLTKQDHSSGHRPGPQARINPKDIRRAIAANEFKVYFQPKVVIATQQTVGFEALLRWQHPVYGLLEPKSFISVAEDSGQIDAFTPLIISHALRMCKKCAALGCDIKISVNLSVDSLNRLSLPEEFSKYLENENVDNSNIIVEVTESRIMGDITVPLEVLTRMRLKGFELSIDDFGTGYSTLEQLKRIPFVELKIDRSFVTGATKDQDARAILESSVNLAKSLHLAVVAEGVETHDDYELVKAMGCDIIQGYLISEPLDFTSAVRWLQSRSLQQSKQPNGVLLTH
ncbi:MAG: EAL domain-containing protein, partial [Gammaproteobacteria bacterium]|nr:EAL domain-containing protein [Gammaproteobacteria bacterium]